VLRPEQLKLDPGAGELILRLPARTPIGRGKSIRVFAEPDDVVVLNR